MALYKIQEPSIAVRGNRRHEIINMAKMNGDNLPKLRIQRTSETGRIVRSWNLQLNKVMQRNVVQWYQNQNFTIAKFTKDQRKICHNLNRYHKEQRKIFRRDHYKKQEDLKRVLEGLRIKFIARKVVSKFRENVLKKKAQRNLRRKSKRKSKPKEIVDENANADVSPDILVDSVQDDTTNFNSITDENIKRLEQLYENAKLTHDSNSSSNRNVPLKSTYIEASRDCLPKIKSKVTLNNLPLNAIYLNESITPLPPMGLLLQHENRMQPISTKISDTEPYTLSRINKSNDPFFKPNFETIPENDILEESIKCLSNSNIKKSSLNHPSLQTSNSGISDAINDLTAKKPDIYIIQNNVERSEADIKQSVLNRIKKRETEIRRNQILNSEPPVIYTKDKNGDIVVSLCRHRRNNFLNDTARVRYEREKFKVAEQEQIQKQRQHLKEFVKKLQELGKEKPPKPKSPPKVEEEKTLFKSARRPSLSISMLLNHPFTRTTVAEDELMLNCSYIREFEPVRNEQDREILRQRKRSSWLLPSVSDADQQNLATLHHKAVSGYF